MDAWFPDQIEAMKTIGNARARAFWEAGVPANYPVPDENSSELPLLSGPDCCLWQNSLSPPPAFIATAAAAAACSFRFTFVAILTSIAMPQIARRWMRGSRRSTSTRSSQQAHHRALFSRFRSRCSTPARLVSDRRPARPGRLPKSGECSMLRPSASAAPRGRAFGRNLPMLL